MTGKGESVVIDDERAPATSNQEWPVEESSTPRPKGFRRYLRFNLLTALILFLLVSAYFGVRQRFVISQEEAAAKKILAKSGAALVEKPAAPVWLRDLLLMQGEDFRHVEEVRFPVDEFPPPWVQAKVEAAGPNELEALTKLPRLRSIGFSSRTVDDEALAYLAQCASLEEIRWQVALVNDTGIDHLAQLRELRSITLAHTFTTDRSLETLGKLPELRSVVLDDSTTERGIAALARYAKLEHVDATATSLRAEDVRSLVDRGVAVTLPPPQHSTDADPEEQLASHVFGATPIRLEIAAPRDLGKGMPFRISSSEAVVEVQFHETERVDERTLAEVLRDPRVVCVDLPAVGPPYRFDDLQKLLAERPTDAPRCRIVGHVLISGQDLLNEVRRSLATGTYLTYDVTPESREALRVARIAIIGDRAFEMDAYLSPGESVIELGDRDLTVPVEPDE